MRTIGGSLCRARNPLARKAGLLFTCLTLSCCGTAGLLRSLEREQQEISALTELRSTSTRKRVTMSWSEAKKRMLEEDHVIRQSRLRFEDLRRERESQWKEWLPRPSFYVNLQNSLGSLGDLSRDSLSFSMYAPLTIPNPWTQTAKAYQYALQELQAADSLELTRRRQVIALYRLFEDYAWLDEGFPRGTQGVGLEEEVQALLRSKENEMMREERVGFVLDQLSRTLNLPGTDVSPQADTLPSVSYEGRLAGLEPGRNYGHLATRLASYEIQSALLRRKGLQLEQWPTPVMSASMPPVYDTRRTGGGLFENSDEISLFGTWSKSFDLTGREAAEIRSAEDNLLYVRETLRLKLDSEARTWNRLKKRYAGLLETRDLLRNRLELSLRGVGQLDENMENARGLFAELENLERAKRTMDMEIWLWDDKAWN